MHGSKGTERVPWYLRPLWALLALGVLWVLLRRRKRVKKLDR